jgi:hypothetical protein
MGTQFSSPPQKIDTLHPTQQDKRRNQPPPPCSDEIKSFLRSKPSFETLKSKKIAKPENFQQDSKTAKNQP